MLLNEASWMAAALAEFDVTEIDPIVNLGSGSEHFRTERQPYIQSKVLGPLRKSGVSIVNVDLKDAPGVDINGSVFDPRVRRRIGDVRPNAVLCQNMLEHVPDARALAAACEDLVPVGGLLFISVPKHFPYHPDPIDTMYRPRPDELASIFSQSQLVKGEVVNEVPLRPPSPIRAPLKTVKLIGRLILPYPSSEHRKSAWSRVASWNEPCSVTCAVFRKVSVSEERLDT